MKAGFWIPAALLSFPLLPASAQQSLDQPGTVSHVQADAHFPERVGAFQRSTVTQYGDTASNIGASYNLIRPEGRLLVTVYVYPSPDGPDPREARCESEFNEARMAIVGNNKSARPTDEGRAPDAGGVAAALRHRSVYELTGDFGSGPEALRSELDLYCFVDGRWQVKYRATSNAGFNARREIERFIRTGPWPGRAERADPRDVTMRRVESTPAP